MTPHAIPFAGSVPGDAALRGSVPHLDGGDLPMVDVAAIDIPSAVLARVDAAFAERRQLLPYAWTDGCLCVVVADPLAMEVADELAYATGVPVRLALAPADALAAAIRQHYGAFRPSDADVASPENKVEVEAPPERGGDDGDLDEPVVRWVQRLIAEASRRRASDIHVEPLATRLRVRYRIDGSLLEVAAPPQRHQAAVISRIKIMANLSIAEKRLPQDGRIQFSADGHPVDLRVSSLPTAHGESVVMRLLDQSTLRVGLSDLGFLPDQQAEFVRGIASPDGMVLVTGPTGSGKTTTLYAGLHHLNHPDRKIITVEDPVEYQLVGVNQVPVSLTTGMTFASALRAMLRQAPNVVMVGEIRDRETADTALHAALTGHLVLSTLHTNDAPAAVTRLIDLGAKPFVVAAALRAVVAQRLVRRVCESCRRADRPSPGQLRALGLGGQEVGSVDFVRGAGCVLCHGTGYRGQVGLFEFLPITEDLRKLIYDNVTAARLRTCARRDGLRTLRADGIRKVLAGLTTIEEVLAVTVGDPP